MAAVLAQITANRGEIDAAAKVDHLNLAVIVVGSWQTHYCVKKLYLAIIGEFV